MKIRFIAQPYADGTDLRDFLHAVANEPDLSLLRIVVAWAKRSGLGRAAADLAAIRGRGGTVLAVVGVSEGGATEQGLRALVDQTDDARVFHDRGRTFHPKVYLAESDRRALLLVGSHNLTAGGLAWNYEAGLWVELDRGDAEDEAVRDDVVGYFERLRADTAVCRPLDAAGLANLLGDPALVIRDEDVRAPVRTPAPDAPEDSDSVLPSCDAGIGVFGRSRERKRPAPPLVRTPWKAPPRSPAPVTGAVAGTPVPLVVARRWFKEMDGTAAQHPPGATSKPTGNLRLSQEAFAIDHKRYFREVFFGGLDWRPRASMPDTEEVWVPMQVVVAGDYLGEIPLRVSHALKRLSVGPTRRGHQSNIPTVLHWGDLGARLRRNNYEGLTVTLERDSDDRFALSIADGPTGPFAY